MCGLSRGFALLLFGAAFMLAGAVFVTAPPEQPAFADCTNDPLVVAMRSENCAARWGGGACDCGPTCACSECPDHDAAAVAAKRAHVFPPHRDRFDAKVAACACASKADPDDVAGELKALRERVAALESRSFTPNAAGNPEYRCVAFGPRGTIHTDDFAFGPYPGERFDVGERPIAWSTSYDRGSLRGAVFAIKEDGVQFRDDHERVAFVSWRDIAAVVHGHIGKK